MASRAETLTKEIHRLHRGRGIHSRDFVSRIGPTLAAVIFGDAEPPLAGAREAVAQQLKAAAEQLPENLRLVFLAGLAVSDNEAYLKTRLERVGKNVDRGTRTVRRWLDEADASIALVLERRTRVTEDANPFAARGWYVERLESYAYLGERPRFAAVRDIRVTHDSLRYLCESFSVPHPPGTDTDPDVLVEPTEGCDLVEVERFATSTWRLRIHLSRELLRGETHRVGVVVTWPSLAYIRPYNVIVPVRATKSFLASADFAANSPASAAWRYDGVPPAAIDDASRIGTPLEVTPGLPISHEWPLVRRGLAYGIGWSLARP